MQQLNLEWNPEKFNILGVEFTIGLDNISDRNIEPELIEMQREINQWSKRDLTPFGRVTVIKTIVLSKIIHILTTLPTPSKIMMCRINTMLYQFLWSNKPDKIKRNIARQKLENGGINMTDIYFFEKSLKLTWIRRLLISKQKWKHVISCIYPKILKIQNFGNCFVHNLSKDLTNEFWADVMFCLFDFVNKIDINSQEELNATSFLHNSKFKIGNDTIKSNNLISKNIFFIYQLQENDDFLNVEQFREKYNIQIDFLSYNAIIRCIRLQTQNNDLEKTGKILKHQPALNVILKSKKGTTDIYQSFIGNSYECKGKQKWINTVDINEDEWISSFTLLKRTTSDTKLRWLQFRNIHHILTTNRSASKFMEDQSDLCHYCNQESETIRHLLWQCNVVKAFWNELCKLINDRCKHAHDLKISEKLVILGQDDFIYTDRILDYMILVAKLYIYRCKCQDRPLLLRNFITDIYNRYCVDKYLRKNSSDFKNDWSHYTDLFKSLM